MPKRYWFNNVCDKCEMLAARLAEAENMNAKAEQSASPLQVKCARCGIDGTSETFIVEEGDEWECPTCWERCEAQERARLTVTTGAK